MCVDTHYSNWGKAPKFMTMPEGLPVRYYLFNRDTPVTEQSDTWNAPLPMHRQSNHGDGCLPERDAGFSYGAYFQAVQRFLRSDGYGMLADACARHLNVPVFPRDIRQIDIFLEKHGAFYHPARIETRIDDALVHFVLNVAVSEAGRVGIRKEYSLLRKLNDIHPWRFLPTIYGLGPASPGNGDPSVEMFLGEWCEGYHEFHISGTDADGKTTISMWDPSNGSVPLPQAYVYRLYRQAAAILTVYYDLKTGRQIYPWHHAAGDFIVCIKNNRLDLKLISVRGYAPLVGTMDGDPEKMLHALLIFLLNLSVRMRLDRLNGIGDLVWADERAVQGSVNGFFDGLAQKASHDPMAAPLDVLFRQYMRSCTQDALLDVSEAVVNGYPADAPETRLTRKALRAHVSCLYRQIQCRLI